jgi:hypothetical protein
MREIRGEPRLDIRLSRSDTVGMNGIGVGTAVGLGAIIGLGLVAGEVSLLEYVTTLAFYGLLSGFIFQLYKIALADWKPPRFPWFRGRP